jgi:twitching motility protein PilT
MSDHRKIIENLVALVVREGASDLHITADRHPSIRVSGDLVAVVKEPVLSADDTMGIALSLLGEENKKMFLDKKDIDFSYSPDGVTRFRGNAFFQQGKVGVALRLIQSKIRTLAELNLPEKLYQITAQKQGFFLCVGPVGQGKSTTLAALIESINQERAEHIITIEDPIEYMFTGDKSIIDQREVRFDTPGFAIRKPSRRR